MATSSRRAAVTSPPRSGRVPLKGPGFTLTLDDAPGSGADEESETAADEASQGRVIAKDLQFVTNALWESGAEAISINGKRLTSTSSIRFAGSAIIVDYRPLTRPYVITALGDPQRFPAAFADGRRWHLPVDAAQLLRRPRRHRGEEGPHRPGSGGPDDPVRPPPGILGPRRRPPSPSPSTERSPS